MFLIEFDTVFVYELTVRNSMQFGTQTTSICLLQHNGTALILTWCKWQQKQRRQKHLPLFAAQIHNLISENLTFDADNIIIENIKLIAFSANAYTNEEFIRFFTLEFLSLSPFVAVVGSCPFGLFLSVSAC